MASTATPTALVYSNVTLNAGDNTITSGIVGKRIYVTQYTVSSTTPLTIQSTDKSVQVVSLSSSTTSAGGTSSAILPLGVGLIATATAQGTASGYIMGFVI